MCSHDARRAMRDDVCPHVNLASSDVTDSTSCNLCGGKGHATSQILPNGDKLFCTTKSLQDIKSGKPVEGVKDSNKFRDRSGVRLYRPFFCSQPREWHHTFGSSEWLRWSSRHDAEGPRRRRGVHRVRRRVLRIRSRVGVTLFAPHVSCVLPQGRGP